MLVSCNTVSACCVQYYMLSMHLSKVSLWKEKLFAQKPKRTQACSFNSSNAALYLLLAVLQLLVHERLLLLLPGVPPLRHGFLLLQSSVSKCSVQTSLTPDMGFCQNSFCQS